MWVPFYAYSSFSQDNNYLRKKRAACPGYRPAFSRTELTHWKKFITQGVLSR